MISTSFDSRRMILPAGFAAAFRRAECHADIELYRLTSHTTRHTQACCRTSRTCNRVLRIGRGSRLTPFRACVADRVDWQFGVAAGHCPVKHAVCHRFLAVFGLLSWEKCSYYAEARMWGFETKANHETESRVVTHGSNTASVAKQVHSARNAESKHN
jgi:hypothetical protein